MADPAASGGADAASGQGAHAGILRRALANAGLLLSGKASAAIMQLATFALAARGLGIEQFGYFSILIAQVTLLMGLAAFESNQAIIRYGVDHLSTRNARGFQALVKTGTVLDLGAATAATIVAFILPPLLGPSIGWSEKIIADAQLIAPLAYANAIATPKGMLRLFGRFGVLTAHAIVTPAARLIGVVAASLAGAGLSTYLLVWLAAGWLGAIVAFWLGWREAHRRDLLRGIDGSLRALSRDNPGVWRFTLYTNLHTSVALIPAQGSTFIVGALMGPAPAALFKIARELGTGMAKPIELMNQALFPDIARLVRDGEWQRLTRAAVRAGAIAGLLGLVVALGALLFGEWLIVVMFGVDYAVAAPLLAFLAFATALRVFAFAADPILYALHKPQAALAIALLGCLLFLAMLFWRAQDGPIAAAIAFLAMNVATSLLSAAMAIYQVRRARRAASEVSL